VLEIDVRHFRGPRARLAGLALCLSALLAIGSKLLLLSLLGVLVGLVVIGTLRIERSMWITRMINRLADTSAQIRIRLSMLLVVGLGALATHLGFAAAGLLQATSLPFIVAATTIGLQLHAIRPANAATLVAAGLLSAKGSSMVPEQAHVR
jgi:hypothetical protein